MEWRDFFPYVFVQIVVTGFRDGFFVDLCNWKVFRVSNYLVRSRRVFFGGNS